MAETKIIEPYENIPFIPLNNVGAESRHGANMFSNVKQFAAGFGSKVFRVDRDGLWLGAETFAAAPFSVDMEGNVTLTSLSAMTGFYDTDLTSIALPTNGIRVDSNGIYGRKSGVTTFSLDTSGNATFTGTITGSTITGGTIQTDTTGYRLVMSGADNAYQFYSGASLLAELVAAIVPNSGTAGAYLSHPTDNAYMGVSGSAGSGWAGLGGSGGYFAVDSTISASFIDTDLRIASHWLPQSDDTYDLGSSTYKWQDLYLSESIFLEEPAGSSTVEIKAPSLSASYTLTLPTTDGTSGQVLSTNGSGVLSWIAAGAGADTDLNNLTTTSINQSLIPEGATQDLGTSALPWDRGYIDDVYLTNGDGGIYYNANLALDFYATRIELGSTYDDLSPASALSSNFGDTNRWNAGFFDTLDLTGAIDMNNNRLNDVDELRLHTGTANTAGAEGAIAFYDSGSIQYRGQIVSTEYSFDLTAA